MIRSQVDDVLTFYAGAAAHPERPVCPEGFSIGVFQPRFPQLRLVDDPDPPPLTNYLYWYFASVARYRIVGIRHGEKLVHVSHVLTRNPRLAFMYRDDLHVGPSRTDPDYRRLGLFATAIRFAVAAHWPRTVWAWSEETNIASRRAMESAGLHLVGRGHKRTGRYRLTEAP